MVKIVTHSRMDFIDSNAFHIEKSSAYTQLGENIRTVEFIRAMGNRLMFVEAKSSFANPNTTTPNPSKGNKTGSELFHEEVEEICDKFVHSLNLYSSIAIGINGDGFPHGYAPSEKVVLDFILVINVFQKSWCDEIERALLNKIRESNCLRKIWKPQISVMNHEDTKKRKLLA